MDTAGPESVGEGFLSSRVPFTAFLGGGRLGGLKKAASSSHAIAKPFSYTFSEQAPVTRCRSLIGRRCHLQQAPVKTEAGGYAGTAADDAAVAKCVIGFLYFQFSSVMKDLFRPYPHYT